MSAEQGSTPTPAASRGAAASSPGGMDDATAAALAAGRGPRRFGSFYVAEHMVRSMRAYGWTIVASSVGNPLIYLLGIGLGLAAFLDTSVADGADGPVSYVQFVAPALLATAAVTVATEEFTYTVMSGFKWRRIYWAANASAVSPGQIADGVVLAVAVRMIVSTVAYYGLMVLLGAVGDPWTGAWMPLVGVLGGMAFGLPLLAYAATLTEDRGQFAMVQRFVFTPLFLFSGTFYPLSTLPGWLEVVGWVSPLWHASEIGRSLSYGSPPGAVPVGVHLVVLVAMALVGGWAGRRMFVRRLRQS